MGRMVGAHRGSALRTPMAIGIILWTVLSIPPVDGWFDAVMARHMLVQLPLLILSGVLAGRGFAVNAREFNASAHGVGETGAGESNTGGRTWRSLGNMFARIAPWDHLGLSTLFFFLGSLAFWMLPVSFDGAVENWLEDLLMHANFFVAGVLLPGALSRMNFAVRAAAGIYLTAMLASAAMTYLNYEGLICNVYTIEMQQETGRYLLWALPVFFVVHVVTLFRGLRK